MQRMVLGNQFLKKELMSLEIIVVIKEIFV